MKFTQIPSDAFKKIQMNAGILVDSFTPATSVIGNLIGATSGGVNFTATPTYSDYGDDIDNCPKNMLELKKLESWEAKMSGTFISVSADVAKMLVGAGDYQPTSYKATTDTEIVAGKTYYTKTGSTYTKVDSPVKSDLSNYFEADVVNIVPRNDIASTDFSDVWWIGDYSNANDGENAGFCAIHLKNALSTTGFQIQSADKAKGTFTFEFTGHYSMDSQTEPPFDIYIKEGV